MCGIIEWLLNWKKCGWKIVSKQLVKNVDFWQVLDEQVVWYQVEWQWVCGYIGDFGNEWVDQLVNCGVVELLC